VLLVGIGKDWSACSSISVRNRIVVVGETDLLTLSYLGKALNKTMTQYGCFIDEPGSMCFIHNEPNLADELILYSV
jgi:uncharacterized protein (UPF0218 family)